jgi:hypothetical protein
MAYKKTVSTIFHKYQLDDYLLIRQPFVTRQQIDDTAIGEAVP